MPAGQRVKSTRILMLRPRSGPTVTGHDLHLSEAESQHTVSGGAHPKRFQSIEDRCTFVLDGVLWVEPKRGETLEQRRNGDLSLRSGERSAQAVMVSTAEGEMGGIRPLNVEAVRVGVPRRVMPRCEQQTGQRLTRLHLPAGDLQRLQREPGDLHNRRVVA